MHLTLLNWFAGFIINLEELSELVLVQFEGAQVSKVEDRSRQVYQAISTDSELLQIDKQVNIFGQSNYSWVLAKIKLCQISVRPKFRGYISELLIAQVEGRALSEFSYQHVPLVGGST